MIVKVFFSTLIFLFILLINLMAWLLSNGVKIYRSPPKQKNTVNFSRISFLINLISIFCSINSQCRTASCCFLSKQWSCDFLTKLFFSLPSLNMCQHHLIEKNLCCHVHIYDTYKKSSIQLWLRMDWEYKIISNLLSTPSTEEKQTVSMK